ncbi:LysR family transcriptional regulator [Aliiglaciecola lipolytica]|uniref:Regulatory protein LysR:LysR substrate-binding n=1 Tax=Aliiglaciecola lipolytica E3 TaxID=1127673 RepID=K6YJW0_9ALTE|nr:LysR substrate-binding domain-containing protein [Aliiglaciecola lipolytica]GAC16888.1 regulatory protein LysR:LysR substrate-binding [Aliiglaciecola lipolytica E3]
MRLRHIEVFHAIYTTGSVTNAAKILHVSQPSVSKVLTHAEMQLGFKLFERIKGRLYPTNEAELLFDEVEKIYQQMRTVNNTAKNIQRSGHGSIRMGVTPALGFDAIPEAIVNFLHDFPNVNFDVKTVHNDEVMQALVEHKCDFALLYSPKKMASVAATKCADSELVIMYPKEWFSELPKELTLAALAGREFIDISDSGPLADLLWSRIMEEKIQFSSHMKVQTYFIAARMVTKGLGFCVVDKPTALANTADNIAIASFAPKLKFDVTLLHLENRKIAKVAEEFIPYLKDTIAID